MKTILVDLVHCFFIVGHGMYAPMYELLEQYPNKKILLTGCTDADFRERKIFNMPYEVFTLKNDPPKSQPIYFETMLREYHLSPEDTLYFEHNPSSAASAEAAGIQTYLYDNEKKDMHALKAFLDRQL